MTAIHSLYRQLASAGAALALTLVLIGGTVATPPAAPAFTVASEFVA